MRRGGSPDAKGARRGPHRAGCSRSGSNAVEAQELILAGLAVDLVFSDITMPGQMDGIALAQWLHGHLPGVPVVLTSGVSSSLDAASVRASTSTHASPSLTGMMASQPPSAPRLLRALNRSPQPDAWPSALLRSADVANPISGIAHCVRPGSARRRAPGRGRDSDYPKSHRL